MSTSFLAWISQRFLGYWLPQSRCRKLKRGCNSLIMLLFAFVCVCLRLSAFVCILGPHFREPEISVCLRSFDFNLTFLHTLFYYTHFAAPWSYPIQNACSLHAIGWSPNTDSAGALAQAGLKYWEKLNPGVSKPTCFPLFSGKVQIVSQTLSGLFLVGALNRPRKRKRTNRENPRRVPGQIGKIPGKVPKWQKRTKKEGQVQIGKPPRLKHPRLAALENTTGVVWLATWPS